MRNNSSSASLPNPKLSASRRIVVSPVRRFILSYLRFWAVYFLKKANPMIVGVTGSEGKSSCVYLLDKSADPHFKVRTTLHGNSETGIPLEILGLRDKLADYRFRSWLKILLLAPFSVLRKADFNLLIAEMGVDSPYEPKNMSYLLKFLKPDIGVFLFVAPAHTEQFARVLKPKDRANEPLLLSAIAKEKGKLVMSLTKDQTAILNIDSPYIRDFIPKIKARKLTVSLTRKSDVRLVSYNVDLKHGTQFDFVCRNLTYTVNLPQWVLTRDFGITIGAVMAVSVALEIPVDEAVKSIESSFVLPPGRMSVIAGKKNTNILDSSYNASPTALSGMLGLLKTLGRNGKRVAVLGDMQELGELAPSYHRRIARQVYESTDRVITVGPLMHQYMIPALLKLGFPRTNIFSFKTAQGVGKFIATTVLKGGELVLVKGSQNTIYLEQVVEELMADPENKDKMLCRQSKYWDKVRNDYFRDIRNEQIPLG